MHRNCWTPCTHLVHVQGSTCAMVESMLRASGYRTGLFTSPHLCDIRERFRIQGCEYCDVGFNMYMADIAMPEQSSVFPHV